MRIRIIQRPCLSPSLNVLHVYPGHCGVCSFPDFQCFSEICSAACQRGTWPAAPGGSTAHASISGQSGHQPNNDTGKMGKQQCENNQITVWNSLFWLEFGAFLCLLDLMAYLSCPNIFRILSQCSPSLWAELVAPSLRPSFPSRAHRTCSRFRCQAAGSTMSGSSQQQQLAVQDSPVFPVPAPYRQVTS